MFGFRIILNRRNSGGILRNGLLRDNGLGRLCIDGCTFLYLDHLVVSRRLRCLDIGKEGSGHTS